MKLHYKEIGEGKPLIIVHGLFGSLDNWQTHAKKLADYFRVILIDQRNHGHSDWSDQHNYELMSEDLHELVSDLGLKDFILMGHSMGGKTAMYYAQKHPEYIDKLIIVDMGIKAYLMHHQEIIDGIKSLNLNEIKTRGEAETILKNKIHSIGVRQFILKNLYWKEKNQLAWRMNVEALENNMTEILAGLDLSIKPNICVNTLFIRGNQSNYILDSDIEEIEEYFIDSEIVSIDNAGHWVHSEQPEQFINTVLEFCLR